MNVRVVERERGPGGGRAPWRWDLKPQNVRVSADLRVPRLIDLGLAVEVRDVH